MVGSEVVIAHYRILSVSGRGLRQDGVEPVKFPPSGIYEITSVYKKIRLKFVDLLHYFCKLAVMMIKAGEMEV